MWPTLRVGECVEGECTRPWEEAWAADRAAVVGRISQAGWGVGDDSVLRGPGGLEVDLDRCPPDWDPAAGVTEDEIFLIATGLIGGGPGRLDGLRLAIDEANAGGGVAGRQIHATLEGEGYVSTLRDQYLLRPGPPLAWLTFGTPETEERTLQLAADCIPQPAAHAWGGVLPLVSPWQTRAPLTGDVEAKLWADLLVERLGVGQISVSALVLDNPYGNGLLASFERALALVGSSAVVTVVRHESLPQDLSAELDQLLAGRPDVVVAMTAGMACPGFSTGLADRADAPFVRLMAFPCARDARAGVEGFEGWLWVDAEVDALPPDPEPGTYAAATLALIDQVGLDEVTPRLLQGYWWGWLQIELMRIAAELPGGLTRANLVLAAWSADLRPPGHPQGVRYRLNGLEDPHGIEDGLVLEWTDAGPRAIGVRSAELTRPPAARPAGTWPSEMIGECADEACTRPWEAAWAADRAAVVERIISGGYGIDRFETLRGPDGREVDLAECGLDWDRVERVADDEIVIGLAIPQSGGIGWGMDPGYVRYFDELNESGGIGGRRIRVVVRDTGNRLDATTEAVRTLIEDDGALFVAASSSHLDQADPLAAEACVPLVAAAGARHLASTTDWLTLAGMSGRAEGMLWAEAILELTDEHPLTVSVLSDHRHYFAEAVSGLVERLAAAEPEMEIVVETLTTDGAEVHESIDALLARSPDVVVAADVGLDCLALGEALADVDALAISSTFCAWNVTTLYEADHFDGWWSVNADDRAPLSSHPERGTYESAVAESFSAVGEDPQIWDYVLGYRWAWMHGEILRIASELPGGLSTTNLLLAAWSAELRPPSHRPGVWYSPDPELGPVTAGVLERYDATLGEWVDGKLIYALALPG